MRPSSKLLPLAGAAAVVLLAAPTGLAREAWHPDHARSSRQAEVRRIQAHFDSVLIELATRDVSALSDNQRERRSGVITTLRAYRDRGVFPRNYDFPRRAVPYFVDRKTGVLCAVAHLLETTGRRDIVDRVARANNNVWVAELAPDTAFASWLARSGLTLAEAARIQVPYDAEEPATATAVVLGTVSGSLFMSAWNATANHTGKGRIATVLGYTFGVAAMVAGPPAADGVDGFGGGVAAISIASGALSTVIATRGVLQQRRFRAARRAAEAQTVATKKEPVEATLTPTFSVAREPSAGVALRVHF